MIEIHFIITFRLQKTTETMEINLYLHLDYYKTTEIMDITFIFPIIMQQYHVDDPIKFYTYI